MICPHCGRTIREEEQNLMRRDPDAEIDWDVWYVVIVCAILFVIASVAFAGLL